MKTQGPAGTAAPPATRSSRTPVAIGIGVFAGALSGLFGVGGGILIVPALVIVAKVEQRLAHGTSLAGTFLLSVSAALGYALSGEVDWLVGALMFAGAAGGAILGTSALRRVNQTALRYGFALLLLATAARMLWDVPEAAGEIDIDVLAGIGLVLTGLFSGTVAGLMGVGGGIIMVPAQMLLFGVPGALAKGTSLAVIVPTAFIGTVRNKAHDNIDLRQAVIIGVSGMVTSFLAARVAIGLSDELSAILFAGLLTVASIRLLVRRRSGTGEGPVGVEVPAPAD
ncbi:MAG: sulfite exporter TauE/SafE family protein [Actinobacteria bacterium]|nr:sulfite exporter TauE/SafE family protein [Actinomycetota bacterium]